MKKVVLLAAVSAAILTVEAAPSYLGSVSKVAVQTRGDQTQMLKQFGMALTQYGMDNNDQFPDKSGAAGLEQLRKGRYLANPAVFIVRGDANRSAAPSGQPMTEKNTSFAYVGNGLRSSNLQNAGKIPVIFVKPDCAKDDRFQVLFADGHVTTVKLAGVKTPADLMRKLPGIPENVRKTLIANAEKIQ